MIGLFALSLCGEDFEHFHSANDEWERTPITNRTSHHPDLCNWSKAPLSDMIRRTGGAQARLLDSRDTAQQQQNVSFLLLDIWIIFSLQSNREYLSRWVLKDEKGMSCHSLRLWCFFSPLFKKASWVPVEYRCCAIWWEFITSPKHAGKFTRSKWEKKNSHSSCKNKIHIYQGFSERTFANFFFFLYVAKLPLELNNAAIQCFETFSMD